MLLGRYPDEEAQLRRRAVLDSASANTEIVFRVLAGSFFDNRSGVLQASHIVPEVCKAAVQAERDGADAVVPFGTLDPGVDSARHLVDIPVVGAGRAGYHLAATVGMRIGTIVYLDENIPYSRRLLRQFDMEKFVVAIKGVNIGMAEATDRRAIMRERLIDIGRWMVSEYGADVIFPQGVTMIPVQFPAWEIAEEIGVPVIDALAASIRTAETLIDMRVKNSRAAYVKLDSEQVHARAEKSLPS